MKHRKLDEKTACNFFHQIADGIEVLHQHEICHRDLKPENLLLKETPKGWLIKIVDFGLSNTFEGGKLLSTACGSPCYAAPEMIAGKKYEGPKIDIWSMGVILFTLVCGYLPFEDANTGTLYKKILGCSFSLPKWLSGPLKDLIKKVLTVDPRRRYSIVEIRRHPWFALVTDAEIPHDETLLDDDETLHAAAVSALVQAGTNRTALDDALAVKSHCSLTASYFLMKQKLSADGSYVKTSKPVETPATPALVQVTEQPLVEVPTATAPIYRPVPPGPVSTPAPVLVSVLEPIHAIVQATAAPTLNSTSLPEPESAPASTVVEKSDTSFEPVSELAGNGGEQVTTRSETRAGESQLTGDLRGVHADVNDNVACEKETLSDAPAMSTINVSLSLISISGKASIDASAGDAECSSDNAGAIITESSLVEPSPESQIASDTPSELVTSSAPLLAQDSVAEFSTSATVPDADEANTIVPEVNEYNDTEVIIMDEVEVEPFLELGVSNLELRAVPAEVEAEQGPCELTVKERLAIVRIEQPRAGMQLRHGALPRLQGALPARRSPRVQPLSLATVAIAADHLSLSTRLEHGADSAVSVSIPRSTPRNRDAKLALITSHGSPRGRPSMPSTLVCRAPDAALRSSSRPPVPRQGRHVVPAHVSE